jgi:ABC-type sugar transport system, ATPase component
MLRFEDIAKNYGHVCALSNASLGVARGEIRGILGGNGSGKSTLVKIAGGTVVPDFGNIYVDGRRTVIGSPRDAKKAGIIMTSQELSIVPNLTVGENLLLGSFPVRAGFFADRGRAKTLSRDMLETLDLGHRIDAEVASLPENELYMLEFGKALIQNGDILLLDEITSALYDRNVKVVKRVLRDCKAANKTVLFISHRMEELYSICDSVTVMRNGEVVGTFPIGEKSENELLALMVGQESPGTEGTVRAARAEDGTPVVEATDIPIRQYRKKVSIKVMPGEIIGVAGLQGHGQSDIVRTLHGLHGEVSIRIMGKPVTIGNPRQAVLHGFAFISGDRRTEGVFKEHSVGDNLTAVGELSKGLKMQDIRPALDTIKVKYDSIHQNLTSLSGGNQQKVIVGRWTSTNPLLILADDPTKGIDVRARSELHALFAEMSKTGSSLIMVSSDDNELVSLCKHSDNSRVIVLYEGEIVKTLRNEEITRDNILAAAIPQKTGIANDAR